MVAVSPADVTDEMVFVVLPFWTNPAESAASMSFMVDVAKGSLATPWTLTMSIVTALDEMAVWRSINRSYPSITFCCSGVHLDVLVGEELPLTPGVYAVNPEGLSPPQPLNPSNPATTTDTDTTERQDFTCASLP